MFVLQLARRLQRRFTCPFLSMTSSLSSSGLQKPLNGIRVIELAGLAPAPFCGLILADFGANVTVVCKDEESLIEQRLMRGKQMTNVDLKSEQGLKRLREMCATSDVLIDPYRPGVLEKLGLDPIKLLRENKRLIIARLTGYGQTGELCQRAGHDINYVALTGLLPTIAGHSPGRRPYWPPANLLADFAGGSLTAAFGILAALLQRNNNGGEGGIVDVSMVEGLSYLGTFITMYKEIGALWNDEYAAFSGDCPIYRTYETLDGKYIAVGALEPKFSKILFKTLNLKCTLGDMQKNPAAVVGELESAFKSKPRDEWTAIFKDLDACVTPVLDMHEVGNFAHHRDRSAFTKDDEKWVPKPAPRIYTADQFKELLDGSQAKL